MTASDQRKFFAMEARGELPEGTALEWAHETSSIKRLPQHVKKKKKKKEGEGEKEAELMTPRQAFKAAVLTALAASGTGIDRFAGAVKEAADVLKSVPLEKRSLFGSETAANLIGRLMSWGGPMAVGGAIAAPVGAGVIGGRMLAKAQDDDTDVEAAKADELIQAYTQLANDASPTYSKRTRADVGREVGKVVRFCELRGDQLRKLGTDPRKLVAAARRRAEADPGFRAAQLIGDNGVALVS